MDLLTKLADLKRKITTFLTSPKTVRLSTYAAAAVFLPAVLIGYIVAQFDPDGYNMIDNFISDMGSFNHTPLPYFLDFGAMITSFLLIPLGYYLEKKLAPYPESSDKPLESSRFRLRLGSLALFWYIIGCAGFFGIGLFSEDRSGILKSIGFPGLHGPFSYVVFGGLVIAGIFLGMLIVLYPTYIPKLIGLYMIFIPAIPGTLFILNVAPSRPFWEWLLMFSIFAWIIPVGFMTIKQTEAELAER